MASNPDPVAQLQAMRAHFAADDHVREEVRIWSRATPEERLREVADISRANDAFLARVDDAALERMRRLRTLSPDIEAVLQVLARARR